MAGTLCAAALLVPAIAPAHTARYDSRITLNHPPKSAIWKGRVFSDLARCVPNRTVELYNVVPGPDVVAGTTTTDSDGHWRIEFLGDEYYAKVTRKVIERPGHTHICRSARSRTLAA